MSFRQDMIQSFYNTSYDEQVRLSKTRQGQLEYLTTMHFINQFAAEPLRILEVGAGTGNYSIPLAKAGHGVTALELADRNFEILRERSRGIDTITTIQGDALNLPLTDNRYDLTLVFGPLYHLYTKADQQLALREAIRVTKPGGILMVAFLSVHAIMYTNYLNNRWLEGRRENFTRDYEVKHFEEQLFTGFNIDEFEGLFQGLGTEKITTFAADGMLELAQLSNFKMSDEAFEDFSRYHIHHCTRPELLGLSSHLVYIARKAY